MILVQRIDNDDFVMPEQIVNAMPEDKIFGITYATDILNENKVAAGTKKQLLDALIFPLGQGNNTLPGARIVTC